MIETTVKCYFVMVMVSIAIYAVLYNRWRQQMMAEMDQQIDSENPHEIHLWVAMHGRERTHSIFFTIVMVLNVICAPWFLLMLAWYCVKYTRYLMLLAWRRMLRACNWNVYRVKFTWHKLTVSVYFIWPSSWIGVNQPLDGGDDAIDA